MILLTCTEEISCVYDIPEKVFLGSQKFFCSLTLGEAGDLKKKKKNHHNDVQFIENLSRW